MKTTLRCIYYLCFVSLINASEKIQTYPFALPPLPYSIHSLKPYIDSKTMDIHYKKHHQGYVNKLNEAIKKYPNLKKKNIVELITSLKTLPPEIQTSIRNNGGGHFAHSLYWKIMSPYGGGKPSGYIAKEINKNFGNVEKFKEKFDNKAQTFFGSGWVWLCTNRAGSLKIVATKGHDVPITQDLFPILVIDVWEHAYYLKHQNKRSDYINDWWNIVYWPEVEKLYKKYTNK